MCLIENSVFAELPLAFTSICAVGTMFKKNTRPPIHGKHLHRSMECSMYLNKCPSIMDPTLDPKVVFNTHSTSTQESQASVTLELYCM